MLLAWNIIYCTLFVLLVFHRFSLELAYLVRIRWNWVIITDIIINHFLILINFILISIVWTLLNWIIFLASFKLTYIRLLCNLILQLGLIFLNTRTVDVWLAACILIVAIFISKIIIIVWYVLSCFHFRLWASGNCFLILMNRTIILRNFWNLILCI